MGYVSVHGRNLGFHSKYKNLMSHELEISPRCADASITVGAENTNVRIITIQLKDAVGRDINYVETVMLTLFLNAAMTSYVVTGGSTGIAIGTDGAIQPLIAKKMWMATSESDGDIDLTWTDTGTEAAFLGVRLPNGRTVISSALTNA